VDGISKSRPMGSSVSVRGRTLQLATLCEDACGSGTWFFFWNFDSTQASAVEKQCGRFQRNLKSYFPRFWPGYLLNEQLPCELRRFWGDVVESVSVGIRRGTIVDLGERSAVTEMLVLIRDVRRGWFRINAPRCLNAFHSYDRGRELGRMLVSLAIGWWRLTRSWRDIYWISISGMVLFPDTVWIRRCNVGEIRNCMIEVARSQWSRAGGQESAILHVRC